MKEPTNRPWIVVSLALTIFALTVGACGPDLEDEGVYIGEAIYIEIDASVSSLSEQVRTEYAAAGVQAAGEFLDQGGSLRVSLFAGDVHAAILYEGELAPPSELDGVQRAKEVVPLRADLEAGLRQGLGLDEPTPEIALAIDRLAPGSDIRGNLGAAMTAAESDGGGLVVIATDGRDNAFGDLPSSSAVDLEATIAAALPANAQGVTVAIVGIGNSRDSLDTETTDKLVTAWRAACESTGATCSVTPHIDLDAVLD